MTAWSDGYNSDIAYTHGFYREISPGYLSYVCLLNGIRTPPLDRPFRYCELGCGQGVTLNMLAACHPQGRFVGIDFNPLHIAGARRLAEEAGLSNVSFREQSFRDAAAAAERAGEEDGFDFITLHGVYSWISPDNRQALVDILARLLKPGGIVYVSYNAQPGWSPMMPLQRLMLAHAAANPGRSDRQFDAALDFLGRLNQAGAGYFAANPAAAQHLATIGNQDRRYLTHEYLNTHWEPLAHAQVVKDLERAKLSYGCSATISHNIDELAVKPDLRAILAEIADPALAETARDFAMNQVFRRDIFVRGAERMARRETEEELRRLRFTLLVPREAATLSIPIPLGELRHDPSLGAIHDALAAGTPSLAEIEARPDLARHDFGTISRFLSLLVSINHAAPLLPSPSAESRAAGARLNQAIARRMLIDETLFYLTAPVIGTGLQADTLERIVLAGLLAGQPVDSWALAGFATTCLQTLGRSVLDENGAPITEPSRMRERLVGILSAMLPIKMPVWQRVGII